MTLEEQNRYAAVVEQIGGYDGGRCFAAIPSLSEVTGALTLDAFARNMTDLARYRADQEQTAGIVPQSAFLTVLPAQCGALTFVARQAGYPDFGVHFDVDARDVSFPQSLQGRILYEPGDHVSLLWIDPDGYVRGLDLYLYRDPSEGFASFSIPSARPSDDEDPAAVPYDLLMAVATPEPLDTVVDFNGFEAATYFHALNNEIAQRGMEADVALIGFRVR